MDARPGMLRGGPGLIISLAASINSSNGSPTTLGPIVGSLILGTSHILVSTLTVHMNKHGLRIHELGLF